jgi:filamentous hemagglutinin
VAGLNRNQHTFTRQFSTRIGGKFGPEYPVRFSRQGFPDFSPYSKANVKLNGLTGNYAIDAAKANKVLGLNSTPNGYVWHHVEDAVTMQLLPQDLHNAVRHTGGAAVLR